MALMSDSCPVKVCRHIPSRTSQSLAEASQAPETNSLVSGARDRLMTSPVCPVNVVVCWPVSMSHRALEQEQITRYEHTSGTTSHLKQSPSYYSGSHMTSMSMWRYIHFCNKIYWGKKQLHGGTYGLVSGHLTPAKGWLSFHSRSCEVLSRTFHGQFVGAAQVLRPEREEPFLIYHSLCTPISHFPRHQGGIVS